MITNSMQELLRMVSDIKDEIPRQLPKSDSKRKKKIESLSLSSLGPKVNVWFCIVLFSRASDVAVTNEVTVDNDGTEKSSPDEL